MLAPTALINLASAWHDRDGWHHGGWWIGMVVFWALVLAVVVALIWRGRSGPPAADPAKTILAERFAAGELTAQEYRERVETLDQMRSQ